LSRCEYEEHFPQERLSAGFYPERGKGHSCRSDLNIGHCDLMIERFEAQSLASHAIK
jgi:hypothetical protein